MNKTFFVLQYIEDHQGQYVGQYRFRSGFIDADDMFKCRYYIIDETFRTIEIFVEIHYTNPISYEFSQTLNDRETNYIVVDALKHLLVRLRYTSHLNSDNFELFLNGTMTDTESLTPIDYVNAFEYLKYHHSITPKTVEQFYDVFIPAMERIKTDYPRYLECLYFLLKDYVYEHEWTGRNAKYLQEEYEFHLPYAQSFVKHIFLHIDDIYEVAKDSLIKCVAEVVAYPRLAFGLTDILLSFDKRPDIVNDVLEDLSKHYVLVTSEHNKKANLGFSYLYAVFHNDGKVFKNVIKEYLRLVVNNTLVYANHDFDQQIGEEIIERVGYDIIIELFQEDFNSFIFTCFPISSFPEEYHLPIRKELEQAVFFFAARMENEQYRLSSFEQTMNINRLMLDNYREWYK